MRQQSHARVRYLVAHPGAELYGSDRVMLESVIGFIEDDGDVVVALPETGPLVDHLRSAGATVEIVPNFVLRKSLLRPRNWPLLFSSAVRGWRAARRLLKNHEPAVVYISTVTLPLWPLAAASRRVPSVIHLHEAEQGASALIKKVMYAPARFARDIVVNSAFSRGVLAEAYPKLADRAHIIYNGVAGPQSVTPAVEELVRPARLVYIGRLSPRKGPDVIVEALALLPTSLGDVSLDIVGAVFAGYEWFENELRERIDRLGLSGRVRMLGFCDEVWSAVDGGDIVVIPSRLDEPFGNTAVEGVLAQRVVLVSDTSGLREATSGFGTALRFAPDDAQALAHVIAEAIAEWPRLQPMLADEAAHASERFSPVRYRAEIARHVAAAAQPATPKNPPAPRRSPASRGTT